MFRAGALRRVDQSLVGASNETSIPASFRTSRRTRARSDSSTSWIMPAQATAWRTKLGASPGQTLGRTPLPEGAPSQDHGRGRLSIEILFDDAIRGETEKEFSVEPAGGTCSS